MLNGGLFRFHHSVLLFFALLVMLFGYFVSFSYGPSAYIFWILVAALVFLVVWQIGRALDGNRRPQVILLEIVTLGFVLSMMTVVTVPYGLFGRDVHYNYTVADAILRYGWPVPGSVQILDYTRYYSDWPGLHFLGDIVSQVLNLPLFSVEGWPTVTKWLPSIISMVSVATAYMLVQRLYHKVKVSLLVTLVVATLLNQMIFHSWFVGETLAIPLLLLFLYFYAGRITSQGSTLINSALAVVCLLALLLTHHLTAFTLVIVLVLLVGDLYVMRIVGRRSIVGAFSAGETGATTLTVALLAIVGFMAYAMYIGQPVFQFMARTLREMLSLSYEPSFAARVWTPRDEITVGLDLLFALLFFALIIIQIRKNRSADVLWDFFGISYGVVATFLLVAGMVVSGVTFLGYGRIEFSAWLFVVLPVAHLLVNLENKSWLLYVIALFALFQVFQVPPYIYESTSEPAYDVEMRYSLATYRAVEWFNGGGTIVGDVTTAELFSGLKQIPVTVDVDIFKGHLDGLAGYDWLVVRRENFRVIKLPGDFAGFHYLTPEVAETYASTPSLLLVYENQDMMIYRVSKASP